MQPHRLKPGRHLVVVTVALVATLLGTGLPAHAGGDEGDQWTNPLVNGTEDLSGPGVQLQVSQGGERVVGPGAPAWLRECRWNTVSRVAMANTSVNGVTREPVTAAEIRAKGEEPDELWRIVTCPINQDSIAANPMIRYDGILTAWRVDDTPPRLLYDYVIARAYASVELPVQLGDAAPYGDDQAPMITQLPTWLWIDPAIWQPVSATTPPLFGVTATVTATPIRVVFHGADEWVDCGPNLGPPYDFTRPSRKQSSRCTLTWRNTSAVADHTLTSTITWAATYTCNTGCGTGTLPNYTITNTRPVRVAELQAVLLPPPTTPTN